MGLELTDDSKHAFRAWLEEKGSAEVVGYCRSANECPVAHFLKWMGADYAAVVSRLYWLGKVGKAQHLPVWASTFVDRLDREKTDFVTAAQALKLLL